MFKNIIGGLAGAVALNILHQTVKQFDHDAPRVDLIGEEALNTVIKKIGGSPLHGDALFTATLSGDILCNALYYSVIGVGTKKYLPLRGALHGLAAGVGALKLTKPMGLSDAPVTRTGKTKVLTVGYYLFGGLVAGIAIKALHKA